MSSDNTHIQALIKTLLEQCRRLKTLVIGDIMVDHYIWGRVSRISPEAPVPVVHVDKDTFVPGGASNVACNLAGLGGAVSLLGAYGKDSHGEQLQALLAKRQIQLLTEGLLDGCATICKTRVIAQRQQVCRIDREDPLSSYHLEDRLSCSTLQEILRGYDAVILSDYAKGVITNELLQAVRQQHDAANRKWLLAMDPKPKRELDLAGLDLMTPNWVEAKQMAGLSGQESFSTQGKQVCDIIYQRYQPRYLVVTLGEDGMLLCEQGQVMGHIPTVAREVFDVSGAGDTVVATLSLALAGGMSLIDAAQVANAAAGIVVSHVGTSPITRELLQEV